MANNCEQVTIGETLSQVQQIGLDLVAKLGGGTDVVFAVDLTQSVNLDPAGRLRLKQIVQDSLKKGDSVYIVPFSSQVNPTNRDLNPISLSKAIAFNDPQNDIETIIEQIPLQANLEEKNTDIQRAEHFVYEKLAQINQNRLCTNKPIKPQSVVWLTDAPLNTNAGINSDTWIETPADSPYRNPNSTESINRQNWLTHLPINTRSLKIQNYQLSVVDIRPTVQESCTPAPGGEETCLVNSYLFEQLWLPSLILILVLTIFSGSIILGVRYLLSLQKTWKLEIRLPNEDIPIIRYLSNKRKLSIGMDNGIQCLGGEIRGYLTRQGNQLILEANKKNDLPIFYKAKKIKEKEIIKTNTFRLNCPYRNREYEINIKIKNK